MSHYTICYATIPISFADAPLVRPIIDWMMGNAERPATLPEHELFQHKRCEWVLHNAAVAWFNEDHPPKGTREYYAGAKTRIEEDAEGGFTLHVRSGVNHEAGVFEHFHDWIGVFIDAEHEHEYGWIRPEDVDGYGYMRVGLPIMLRYEAGGGWGGTDTYEREYYNSSAVPVRITESEGED
ncbi:hypothetical protein H1O16_gp137 [Burkholderia phage BcepSaruman]|uniref:Uncharacterized protein n=1 Tax=Burkholderia phage BcepSaruman TaxID=2530032 RepID=A0A4D5ZD01_9CAUD|nr:hypothetical protein H1O16_gp137 [Burkholderia phage BcepSaruman]QBX06550.1 hypothetical protein BcepSaruman_137 [Burkholderia phage BcepSaruman]